MIRHATSFALAFFALLLGWAPSFASAQAPDPAWETMKQPGVVAIIRHARAPGIGDPLGFRLGDCATQRNLSEEGRAQARRIGEAIRANGVEIGRVLTSQWCRARDTATLGFGAAADFPALNSFFAHRTDEPEQTAAVRAAILDWRGPGLLVLVTHQVNITALTGVTPREGEFVLVRGRDGHVAVEGRIAP